MSEKYVPIKLTDIFPGLDADKISTFFKQPDKKLPKVETIDYLLKALSVSPENIKEQDSFIRNYVYCMTIVRKHFLEIENRLKAIKQKENSIKDKDSYAFKKLRYFEKKNENAKQQIVDFICFGLVEYISNMKNTYSDLIDRNKEENLWILGPTYDYQYNSQYYEPDYDFSTFTKFYNIPNVPLKDYLKQIVEMIELKSNSLNDYYTKVKDVAKKTIYYL